METWIRLAGAVQLAIASANLVAVRWFRYREGLAGTPTVVRQVFAVQNVFLVLVLVGASGLCFFFPSDLAGGSALGRAVSGFFAVFWAARLAVQVFYYSPEKRREHPAWNALFLAAFAALAAVFAIGAIG